MSEMFELMDNYPQTANIKVIGVGGGGGSGASESDGVNAAGNGGNGGNYGNNVSLFGGFANTTGTTGFPITANGLTERSDFTVWNFKLHGTYEPGWGLRFTPVFRAQQGYPYGRVFNATVTGVGQNFMAEPITTHRMETYKQLDIRVAKQFKITGRARLDVLFDVFNVFNSDASLGFLSVDDRSANFARPDSFVAEPDRHHSSAGPVQIKYYLSGREFRGVEPCRRLRAESICTGEQMGTTGGRSRRCE